MIEALKKLKMGNESSLKLLNYLFTFLQREGVSMLWLSGEALNPQ